MNILILDYGSHDALSGAIIYIAQFFVSYITTSIRIPPSIININDVKKIYIRIKNENKIFMQEIFEEPNLAKIDLILKLDNDSPIDKCNYHTLYNSEIYKKICNKFQFNKNILNNNNLFSNNNILGVHFRTTDMNISHNKNHILYYNDYEKNIITILDKNKNFDTIFIASDNNESIYKLRKNLTNRIKIINNDNNTLREKETDTYLRGDGEYSKKNCVETFNDIISLSKCNTIIFTYSNVANLSILLSNTISETIKI